MKLRIVVLGLLAITAALVVASSGGAAGSRPSPNLVSAGVKGASASAPTAPLTPAYCSPCLYYSGDFNAAYAHADAFSNENTRTVGNSRLYTPVTPDHNWSVTKLFHNTFTPAGQVLDPTSVPWEIRTNVSQGNGGTLIASGSSPGTLTATGRTAFGLTEYTLMITLATPVALTQGVTYWVNEMPQCSNTGNAACITRFFESNVDPANPVNHTGPSNIADQNFTNGFFGTWANTDGVGAGAPDNSLFSFGLIGGHAGTLTVTKQLVSSSLDTSKFNLRINGVTKAACVGNGGTTGPVTEAPGFYTVSETACSGSLGNYVTYISCSDGSFTYGTSLSGVEVDADTNTSCLIHNQRRFFKVG
jgi:hypothetical protein